MSEARSLWVLRALALALAALLWFFVTVDEREPLSEKVMEAAVSYKTPPGLIILDPVETARVRVRGATSRVRTLTPFAVDLFVELRPTSEKTAEIHLQADNVILPEDLEVVSIDPNVLRLRVDREVTDMLPIEVRLEGEPSAGAKVRMGEIQIRPPQALVRGPESRISQLGSLRTTPVDLTGHALNFDTQAAILSPDPLIQIVEPAVVTVRVPLDIPGTGDGEDGS